MMDAAMGESNLPRVVIVGGGFGGLAVARQLKNAPCQVTLVDRQNFHLFQPLLYQVATGGLAEPNIATPLRRILRSNANCETIMAEVIGFDVSHRKVLLADGELPYDYLVLAAGAVSNYFGNDRWEQHAPGLKSLDDARIVRMKIFAAFEAAERQKNPERRHPWLNFVVVGGGPTGVELAGAIAEIARQTLTKDFRRINPADARVFLIEGAPRILSPFSEELSRKAHASLVRMGVEVITGSTVTDIQASSLTYKQGEQFITIPTWTSIWGAGVQGNPLGATLAAALGIELVNGKRIPVTPQLHIAGYERIYAIGDLAFCPDVAGKPLPGLGAVAQQQGKFLAKRIRRELAGEKPSEAFRYINRGSMATIGRSSAVAQFGKLQLSGFLGWIAWLGVHIMLLVQFHNRVLVLIQWAWSYFTFGRSARLIQGLAKVKLPDYKLPPSDLKEVGER